MFFKGRSMVANVPANNFPFGFSAIALIFNVRVEVSISGSMA